jgi:hypothetical protein
MNERVINRVRLHDEVCIKDGVRDYDLLATKTFRIY